MGSLTSLLGPQEWQALALSFRVAFWATVCALPVAVPVAWLLARPDFRGREVLSALVMLPLLMPPVVTGYLLLLAFSPASWAGGLLAAWGLPLAFRWTGAALAAGVMGFPLLVRAIRLSIEAVDPRIEEAAATLGASRLDVFFTVTLPLIAPGILAGTILAFAKALGEFGATITFVSSIPGETRTVPLAIWSFLQTPGGEPAALRLALVSVGLSLAALAGSEALARRMTRRLGARAAA